MKKYKVQRVENNAVKISGKSDSIIWNKAEDLTDFSSPWNSQEHAKISFKALYDDENFYFSFSVHDSEVHMDTSGDGIENIGNSDRVELFFRKNKDLNPYYCLEIDPSVRIMDFIAKPNKDFDFLWNWPKEDIIVKSAIQDHLFVVEGSISLKSMKSFGLIQDNKIEAGIFRAKYNLEQNKEYHPTWITWVNPQTEEPNFHISSSFGILELAQLQ